MITGCLSSSLIFPPRWWSYESNSERTSSHRSSPNLRFPSKGNAHDTGGPKGRISHCTCCAIMLDQLQMYEMGSYHVMTSQRLVVCVSQQASGFSAALRSWKAELIPVLAIQWSTLKTLCSAAWHPRKKCNNCGSAGPFAKLNTGNKHGIPGHCKACEMQGSPIKSGRWHACPSNSLPYKLVIQNKAICSASIGKPP